MSGAAPAVGEAIAAAGLTTGIISGGTVVAGGLIFVGGILLLAKVGEKIGDIQRSKPIRPQYSVCCCNKIGPSGKYMCHNIPHKNRKEAYEHVRHFNGATGVESHPDHFSCNEMGKENIWISFLLLSYFFLS